MSHVPHELAEEFPAQKDRIHELNLNDSHFAKLTDEYHAVNRQIHRIETNVEPADESFEKQLRRQRLALKDEINAKLVVTG
jgi:uncharacterized protein